MASQLANFSARKVIKILEQHFGFVVISQRGSHVKLRRTIERKIITVIVPDHSELAVGTLRNILRQAEIELNDFLGFS